MDSKSLDDGAPKKRGRPAGPSREELKAENAALADRLAKLEAAFAAKSEPTAGEALIKAKRLAEAQQELADLRLRTVAPGRPQGPRPQYVPYKGMVQAKEDCVIGTYRFGPKYGMDKVGKQFVTDRGEVFEVDMPALWSDDPFIPVTVVGQREDGSPIVEPRTDVVVIDARWRTRVSEDVQNITARAV